MRSYDFTEPPGACFVSMFQRSSVLVHKARPKSAECLRTVFLDGNAAEHGYFARDATLLLERRGLSC